MSKLVGHTALLPLQLQSGPSQLQAIAQAVVPAWKAPPFLTLSSGFAHPTAQERFIRIREKVTQTVSQQPGPLGRYWHSNNTRGPSNTLLPAQQLMATSPHVGVPGKLADPTTGLHAACRSCLPTSLGTLCSGGWGWPLLPPRTQSRW